MVIVFDPPCIKSPVRTTVSIDSASNPGDAKFIAMRRINWINDELVELSFPGEPIEIARYMDTVWGDSRGGALPMTWDPPDGRATIEVRFAGRPTITQHNRRMCSINVSLERRII